MPIVSQPFCGLTYRETPALSQLVAPPYDVIDPPLQQALLARHPHNVVRLDLNPGVGLEDAPTKPHDGAKALMAYWQQHGVLQASPQPAFWAYTQTWQHEGQTITRQGVLAALLLDADADPNELEHQPAQQTILPHERTLHQYIKERIQLYAATEANLSPIFLMGHDAERQLETQVFPDLDLVWDETTDDDGVVHRLAKIMSDGHIALVQATLAPQRLLIADGHHRFQTALTLKRLAREAYAKTHGQPPALGQLSTDYVLAFITNMADPGLVVYPTHRVLAKFPEGWDAQRLQTELTQIFEITDEFASDDTTIQLCLPNEAPITLRLPVESPLRATIPGPLQALDAALLNAVLFEHVFQSDAVALKQAGVLRFDRDEASVDAALSQGQSVAVFKLHAPPLPLVKTICENGLLMPQKSTYFYPKLLTGLVIYPYGLRDHAAVVPGTVTVPTGLLEDAVCSLA